MNVQNFWNTDLEELEAPVLSICGVKKITDLPTTLDKRVPHGGSVLLDRVVNIDNFIKQPNGFRKLIYRISCAIGI